ncbi:MAG: hypothetical protein V4490_07745, partial [Pseudomonadota bacterium]
YLFPEWNALNALTSKQANLAITPVLTQFQLITPIDKGKLDRRIQFFFNTPRVSARFLRTLESKTQSFARIIGKALVRLTQVWTPDIKALQYTERDKEVFASWHDHLHRDVILQELSPLSTPVFTPGHSSLNAAGASATPPETKPPTPERCTSC